MARSITISADKVKELAERVIREDDSGLVSEYTTLDIERAVQRSLEKAIDNILDDFTDLIWSADYRVRVHLEVQRTCDWPHCERPAKSGCLFCAAHQAEEEARFAEVPDEHA